MKNIRLGFLLGALLLCGCDHRQPTATAQTPSATAPQSDSELTGESPGKTSASPLSPKAEPVTPSTVATPIAPASSPPEPTPLAAKPSSTDRVPEAFPAQPDSPPSAPLAAGTPESTQTADSSPPPAPALSTNSDIPQIVTKPPRAWDETDARKQVVVLETTLGKIVIELNDVAAPRTCGNFRKLVNDGFYNHTTFHRIIPHFMIQGGDPNSKSSDRSSYGQGDPGYTLPAEIKLKHVAGAVAMARLPDAVNPQRDSNGSQFFICVVDCPSLDDQYTVFGQVIKGLDTAIQISNQARDQRDNPTDRIEIGAHLETKKQALEEGTDSN